MATEVKIWRFSEAQGVELIHVRHLVTVVPRQVSFSVKLAYCERGSRVFNYGRRRLMGCEGDLLLISPGEVHGADIPDDLQSSLRILSFPESVFVDLRPNSAASLSLMFHNPHLIHPAIHQAFHQVHRTPEMFASKLERQSRLLRLFETVSSSFVPDDQAKARRCRETGPIHRAKALLDGCYADDITLEDLAQVAGLVPAYLCRAFTKAVGMPPHAYQTALRIAHARRLLWQGNGVGQVAHATGFYDQAHFTRHFTRVVKIPPAQYARQVKQVKNVQDARI